MTSESIIGLVVLAFALSLDNFRSSIALGTVPFSVGRAVQIALVFGFWDTVAPLVGGEIGSFFGDEFGDIAEYVGPVLMGAYGLYLLVGALRNPEPETVDHPWVTLFGMPRAEFLRPGDVVRVAIEGIGTLRNPVVARARAARLAAPRSG